MSGYPRSTARAQAVVESILTRSSQDTSRTICRYACEFSATQRQRFRSGRASGWPTDSAPHNQHISALLHNLHFLAPQDSCPEGMVQQHSNCPASCSSFCFLTAFYRYARVAAGELQAMSRHSKSNLWESPQVLRSLFQRCPCTHVAQMIDRSLSLHKLINLIIPPIQRAMRRRHRLSRVWRKSFSGPGSQAWT